MTKLLPSPVFMSPIAPLVPDSGIRTLSTNFRAAKICTGYGVTFLTDSLVLILAHTYASFFEIVSKLVSLLLQVLSSSFIPSGFIAALMYGSYRAISGFAATISSSVSPTETSGLSESPRSVPAAASDFSTTVFCFSIEASISSSFLKS